MQPPDLAAVALSEVRRRGFIPDFSPNCLAQVHKIEQQAAPSGGARDLTGLLWSSIDNHESRDLDQIEVAERLADGTLRVQVGIADVDSRVERSSPLDLRAAHNTATVYASVSTFPMLPEALSFGLTSLNEDEVRRALVIAYGVRPDGTLTSEEVFPALVRNRAKLAYGDVGRWLEGQGPAPAKVQATPGLAEQLKLQAEASARLRTQRHVHGALELETIEPRARTRDGQVLGLELTPKDPARELIEDFMIAANGVIARYLAKKDRSAIARVVTQPEHWDGLVELARQHGVSLPLQPDPVALSEFLTARRAADPERFPDLSLAVVKLLGPGVYVLNSPAHPSTGHFGLAVHDYTHSTAPNRRFSDLVTQRLVKAAAEDRPAPYPDAELSRIAEQCTRKEDDERKVERFMRKVIAADLLAGRMGEIFPGIVTGVTPKGTFARIKDPPAEGRVIQGERGLKVGDGVRLRLVATAPARGFIDFARA